MRRRRAVLTGLAAAVAAAALPGCAARGAAQGWLAADGAGVGDGPLGESLPLPRPVSRISFGSCADQDRPQPVWDAVQADRPDLHLFGGDNVYASGRPWRAEDLRAAYAKASAIPSLSALRRRVPHLAIWDDNDYGSNDGGAEWANKQAAKDAFLDFWRVPAGDARHLREGIHHARRFGPPGRMVQVLMLDTRWFRSPWQPTDQRNAPGRERYLPSDDPGRTMLGETQWTWLEARLREPAQVRLLMSGIQVVAEGHGWEHWGLFPHEQQRLFDTLARTKAGGAVLLSGDRHIGAVYRRTKGVPYPLTEITSSGLTHAWAQAAEASPNRLGDLVRDNHYALIDIDWARGQLRLSHKDVQGQVVQQHDIALTTLQIT